YDVKVRGGVTMWMPEIAKADDAAEHFTWNSWHCSGIDRKVIQKGVGYFSPMRYSELPRFYRENVEVDVAMIQVTPMDSHGNFSFALGASHLADMLEKAKKIIVEVNPMMPWVFGLTGTEVNIRDVDYVVETEGTPVAELGGGNAAPSAVDTAVANLVVPQIPNGACLQLGIGGMPNTIGSMIAQSDLKDLAVHTEMYVDGFVDMAMAGKITGKYKNVDKGRQVYAFAAGSKKLYD
ncbi:butyryl-CoA:acetate CoA-transferase, partial [gut metagenome]